MINRKHVCFRFFIVILFVTMLILCGITKGVKAASETPLSIFISLVEGDTFGPGSSFHSIVEIRNRDAQGRVDVIVTCQILDPDGKIVLSSMETIAVETLSSFVRDFTLPTGIKEGKYLLMANVSTLNGSKWNEVSRSFTVIVVSPDEQSFIEYMMVVAFIFTGVLWFHEHRRISKLRVSDKDLNKFIEEQKKK
jgi:hypothetical protein